MIVATYDLEQLLKSINKVKLNFMMEANTTFFSALLTQMKLDITEDVPTAATDGISIFLNPYFIQVLSLAELLGLIFHEVCHTVFDHILRCMSADLDKKIYNIAGDHYINLFLLGMGYVIPQGGYADPKYKGWSTRRIYDDLMRNPPDTSNYQMDILPAPKGMDADTHEEKVTSNVIKAVLQAQLSDKAGSIPGSVLQRLEEVLNPKLPWNVILINYMDRFAKDDYSWGRPNKRFLPDFYLPSMHSEAMKQMTVGCDVSGSMCGEDLSTIIAEVRYIWDTLQPQGLRMMTFDTRVQSNELYEQGDSLDDLELTGGGGTNVQPLLESLRDENPELCLIFTDGYFGTPDMSNIYTDVIWIIKGNAGFTAPHGLVIHFD